MGDATNQLVTGLVIWPLCLSDVGISDSPPEGVLKQLDTAGPSGAQAQAPPIRAIALDSTGSLVVAAAGRTVTAINVETGQRAWCLEIGDPQRLLFGREGVHAISLSGNGRVLATSLGTGITVWNLVSLLHGH